MSVVAWDGHSLVADKRGVGEHTYTLTKSKRLANGTVLAWVGTHTKGLALSAWYEAGADVEKYPKFQNPDEWTTLIVADATSCRVYEAVPYPIVMEDSFHAWGSGSGYAMAAMHIGHTAEEAVGVAIELDSGCGNGIDIFDLEGNADE